MTETVLLSANQLLGAIEDPVACMTVSLKAMNDMKHKLDGRLSDKLVQMYSKDFDPLVPETQDSRPMKLWNDVWHSMVLTEMWTP